MNLIETPGLLIWWEESDYYDRFKLFFEQDNKIIIPENNKQVIVYTNIDKGVYHIWRWWGYEGLDEKDFNFNEAKYWRRAQRISWIKYIIENQAVRKSFKDTKNNTICLIAGELEYTVVLQPIKDTHFRLITGFHTYNPSRYYTDSRFKKFNF